MDVERLLEGDHISLKSTNSFGHTHYSHRSPWLRAALLGANDGLVSTASLILGVSAAMPEDSLNVIRLSGISGLVAGSLSMACGEYISVASQRGKKRITGLQRF
jgi:VIT1/CCC1 family predicted Fe2+/Mn2+ transporter